MRRRSPSSAGPTISSALRPSRARVVEAAPVIRYPLDHENVRGHNRTWISLFGVEQQVPGHVYFGLRAEVLHEHIDRVQEVVPLRWSDSSVGTRITFMLFV